MIRFGPAGIPLSCKGRTLRDGISDIHSLGLTAMEVQFIKVNAHTRPVTDEEIGKRPYDLPGELVVEVTSGGKAELLPDPSALTQPIPKKANATVLSWFLAKSYADLQQARVLSRAVDVHIALHAPYYVDFATSTAARERTFRQFRWAAALASALGAETMVGHLGFYGPGDHAAAYDRTREDLKEIRRWLDRLDQGSLRLGIEPSGHPEVFGTREEILALAKEIKGVVPVLNLAHIAARENKKFDDRTELHKLVDDFVEASRGSLYMNFSGVEFYGQGDFRLTPIKRGAVHFDHVAEVLAEREYDGTVIGSSPLLEHDAMYMKLLYERALAKRFARKHAPPSAAPEPDEKPAPTATGKGTAARAQAPSKGKGKGKAAPAPAKRPVKPAAKPRPKGIHARKR